MSNKEWTERKELLLTNLRRIDGILSSVKSMVNDTMMIDDAAELICKSRSLIEGTKDIMNEFWIGE